MLVFSKSRSYLQFISSVPCSHRHRQAVRSVLSLPLSFQNRTFVRAVGGYVCVFKHPPRGFLCVPLISVDTQFQMLCAAMEREGLYFDPILQNLLYYKSYREDAVNLHHFPMVPHYRRQSIISCNYIRKLYLQDTNIKALHLRQNVFFWCEINLRYVDVSQQITWTLCLKLSIRVKRFLFMGGQTEVPLRADSFYRLATSVLCLSA